MFIANSMGMQTFNLACHF